MEKLQYEDCGPDPQTQSCETPSQRFGNNRYKPPKSLKKARARIAKASKRKNRS